MRKSYVILLFLLAILFCTSNCKANFSVTPREISIIMKDEFIQGNTSKKIIIANNIEENINISWYIDNPTQDLIRENKTLVPNLSWIKIEPKWKIIPPNGSSIFYIFLDIPNLKENYNKHWESWPVFKQEESQFFNWEHAIRLYIDTTETYQNNEKKDKNLFSIIVENNIMIFLVIVVFISIVLLLFFVKFKKK
jgi:hypothetical protein